MEVALASAAGTGEGNIPEGSEGKHSTSCHWGRCDWRSMKGRQKDMEEWEVCWIFLVSLFFTLLRPSCHFWHWEKLANMFNLYIFWPPGLPAASVWSILVGTSAGSPLYHLPGLCPVCCFLQGPLVPSDPQWGALDGGDLLVAPVFVFPSPAVGPTKHPA